jgi:hypothetical protein
MNMNSIITSRTRLLHAACCAAALQMPRLLAAHDFEMDWYAVAAGGGEGSGGDFTVSATLEQPEAGDMAGGDFTLTSGFWSIVPATEPPPAFSLSVSLNQGNLVISWPETGSSGFLLEESFALAASGTAWNPVNVASLSSNGTKAVRLPLTAGSRFYRLHRP